MVVKVSNSALQQLKNIHKQGFISQIFVSSGGCSGIKWDIVQIPLSQLKNKDEKINNYLSIESTSVFHLFGSLLDHKVSLKASEFTIVNPNAVHSCGCGKSFTTK
jgi:iron-sulfur cluster assembly accessory protein